MTVKLNITMSLDGFVAGPRQSREHPLGEGGERLHDWAFATRSFRETHGLEGGETGIDDGRATAWAEGTGASIMGRNMFGPVRGPWESEPDWRGWWGDEPPFHHPVFVLTHHPREPLALEGGTVFHFVDGGIEEALRLAREAADGRDVSIGGGASTARQFLAGGFVDRLAVHVVPALLGAGERLFDGVPEGLTCTELVSSPRVAHFTYERTDACR